MSQAKTTTPDFAFPLKVKQEAERTLRKALLRSDAPEALRAAINLQLAESAVSADSLPVVLKQIEEIRHQRTLDSVGNAVMALYEAHIYKAIYNNDRWTIDKRPDVEATQISNNYNLWSRAQFLNKITELIDEALMPAEALEATPLRVYSSVVTGDAVSAQLYPTMLSFVTFRATDILEDFSSGAALLPAALLDSPFDMSLYPANHGSIDGKILKIYRNLAINTHYSAPKVEATARMLCFIAPRVFAVESPAVRRQGLGDSDGLQQAMFDRYLQSCTDEYAMGYLLAMPRPRVGSAMSKQMLPLLKDFEERFPGYFNINAVKNLANDLEQKTVSLQLPEQLMLGDPFRIKIDVQNVNHAILRMYRVDSKVKSTEGYWKGNPASLGSAVATLEIDIEGKVPFMADTTVHMSAPAFGRYIVVPSFVGEASAREMSCNISDCSNLAISTMSAQNSGYTAMVRSAIDGAPVSGASVMFSPWDRRSMPSILPGKTDTLGMLELKLPNSGNIAPRLDKDIFASGMGAYNRKFTQEDKERFVGEIVTPLSLYRLGDRVEYAVIIYRRSAAGTQPAGSVTATITLRDANYQEVAKQNVTTDAWGRATGEFILPEDGLTGQFLMQCDRSDSSGAYISGSHAFMVSDYKLPTFEVTMQPAIRPATLGSPALLKGTATTFAGFPIQDSTVKVQLKVRNGFWWFAMTSPVFYETESRTDAAGCFAVEIPGSVIASSPNPQGWFIADIAVTSPDGETRTATSGFNMGNRYAVKSNMPGTYLVGSNVPVEVSVVDAENNADSEASIRYTIRRMEGADGGIGDVVETDVCSQGLFNRVLDNLPSGQYDVSLESTGTTPADPSPSASIVIWRTTDTRCPTDQLLWLPESKVVTGEMGKADFWVGSRAESCKMLLILCTSDGHIAHTDWITLKGMQQLSVQLPAEVKQARVHLSVVSRARAASAWVDVSTPAANNAIKLHTSTFRNHTLPGSKETVTFKVEGLNGAEPESAVMLSMFNKAIDVLESNHFGIDVYRGGGVWPSIGIQDFNNRYSSVQSAVKYLRTQRITAPDFQTYGRSLIGSGGNMIYLTKRSMTAGREAVASTMDGVMEEEAPVYAAQSYAANMKAEATMAGNVVAEDSESLQADGGTGSPEHTDMEIHFRPSEMPLAFFRPLLQTDSAGGLSVSYTMPDANTTWILGSLAYNREMLTSSDRVEVVASKPVMVSANSPRFLRTSDSVVLQASVMNMTDSAQHVVVGAQLLNVSDSCELAQIVKSDTIAAMSHKVISLPWKVASNVQGVVFKVYVSTPLFTDGEQSFIPILPSEQDVTECKRFYLAPGENHFTMQLEADNNDRAYLKYVGNPAWEVVSALPGLRQGEFSSSVDAAGRIYAAAVANGLMRRYPEIARTIRRWSENPSDSALISKLQHDNELKQMLLNATPWVSDALSQTERMQRLVLLLDGRHTSVALKDAIAELRNTFVKGEGWCWNTSYPTYSQWATMEVLDILGGLNRLGWLPENSELMEMLTEAIRNIDRITATRFGRSPKDDFTTYCYMRMKYPEVKLSSAATAVVKAQVNRIVGEWKTHNVVVKAMDAQILNANGYAATARNIIRSLGQYATHTPERGMWWQQLDNRFSINAMDKVGATAIILDAYTNVVPSAPEVDAIRQWLILNKMDNAWGNAIITTQVVTSILLSGSDWTIIPQATAIRIGDKLLNAPTEYATGSFTENITPMLTANTTLTIDRQGNYPSAGGIVTMRTLPMDSVKACGSDELKITKYLSTFSDGRWIPATHFAVGNRVKVTLIVEADVDMSYVLIADKRAAGLEPVSQLPEPIYSEGLCFYRENRNVQTNIFIDFLPRGSYMLEYELFAAQQGNYAMGVAQIQSQYNPLNVAHSGGASLSIAPGNEEQATMDL